MESCFGKNVSRELSGAAEGGAEGQKAKPSSTNQNNQNNQNNQKNNMNMNDNDEDSPNEDDSDDGRVAVCGVASAEAIAASHASDPGGHCGRPQSPRLNFLKINIKNLSQSARWHSRSLEKTIGR